MIDGESGEAVDPNLHLGGVNEDLGNYHGGVVVANQALMAPEPDKVPLDHLTAGQNLDALCGARTLHDLDIERWTQRFDPLGKRLTGADLVSPEDAKPAQIAEYLSLEPFRSVPFCCAHGCEIHRKHQPEGPTRIGACGVCAGRYQHQEILGPISFVYQIRSTVLQWSVAEE